MLNSELTLIKVHNPFSREDRDIVPVAYRHGQTLLELRNEHFPDIPVCVTVNGRLVPTAGLAVSYPLAGDQILFVPAIHGGDSDTFRMVLMIAIAVAAPYAAAAMLGATVATMGVGGVLLGMAITMVGGMLVNAILPPAKPELPTLDSLSNSQTYSWAPQSTQQQGVAIPKAYGTNKLYGNIISAYLSSDGAKQYVNALISLGAGPFKGIVPNSIMLNDQPAGAFQGVTIDTRIGLLNQPVTTPFADTKTEYPTSVKITYPVPYVYTTIGNAFDALEVELSFPSGLWQSDGLGGIAPYKADIRVSIRRVGEVAWAPITHQVITVKTTTGGRWSFGKFITSSSPGSFGEIVWSESAQGGPDPYEHNEGDIKPGIFYVGEYWHWIGGTLTVADVTVDYITVSAAQTAPLKRTYSANSLEHSQYEIKVENLLADQTSMYYGDDMYLSAVREIMGDAFEYPLLALAAIKALATDQLSGSLRFSCVAECSYVRCYDSVSEAWYYDASDNPAWCAWDAFTKPLIDMVKRDPAWSANAVYVLGNYVEPTAENGYRYECTTVGLDTGNGSVISTRGLGGSSEPIWPTTVGDTVSDGLITWTCRALLTADYEYFNPQTRMYFKVLRYDGMDPSRLDLAKWAEWADFCDVLVPDGKGGTEKRITFNAVFDTISSTWQTAMQICQVGRAVPVWNGTKLTVVVDKPGTAGQLFTVGNIGTGSFRETFLKKADRASSLTMDFIDRDNNYTRDTFTVDLPDIPGTASASIPMIGVTKASEAWRAGMYRLYNNLYLTRSIEIDVGIDSLGCTIGDIIDVQHDVPEWGIGGRLVTADASSATLDRSVTIEAGKSYTIMVRLTDDSVSSRTVTNTPGTYTVLTISTPFAAVPAQYDPYAFGETTKVVKPFRVTNISKKDDQECTLAAVEYNESIYGADSGDPVLPTQNYSSLEVLPPVTDLMLDELLIARQEGTIDDVIDVYFKRPSSSTYSSAEIYYNIGGGWLLAGSTATEQYRIPNVQMSKTYTIAVVTVNTVGDRAKIQNSPQAQIVTLGKLAPPSDVTNFTAVQDAQTIKLSWDQIPDADRWAYAVRIGSDWISGTPLISDYTADSYNWQPNQTGTLHFWIKAIDTSGIESANAIEAIISIQPPSVSGLSAQVIDNNVLLKWSATQGTFPIDHYEVRKGDVYSSATVIGTVKATFSAIFETVAGVYKYWITPVDTAGVAGGSISIAATMAQPPDFFLHSNLDDAFTGTLTNIYYDTADKVWYAPANTSETFATYEAGLSGTTMADFISEGGFTYLIEPSAATGQYVKTFDLTATLAAATVTATLTYQTLVGTVTITPKISFSPDNSTWTDHPETWTANGANFRYVKITIDFAATEGIVSMTSLNMTASVKKSYDSGYDTIASAANGKVVQFNKLYVDVISIGVTPKATAARTAIYDFKDDYETTVSGSTTTQVNLSTGEGANYAVNDWIYVPLPTGAEAVQVTGISGDNLTVSPALSAAPTTGAKTYHASFIAYLFDSTGTKVTGDFSWDVSGSL